MNFRVSIKQILARMRVAEKKKDLKVIVGFKKEVLPFLGSLRREGAIYRFTVKKKTIIICLKKTKPLSRGPQKKTFARDFSLSASLYKNPAALIFLSTTSGVCTKQSFAATYKNRTVGGLQLFSTR
jgi:ribosomal protein S8